MAKPITTTVKQGTSLVQTTEEELKKLSEKAGTSPITPQGVIAIGGNEEQAKMANVPVRKESINRLDVTAPKGTLAQTQRISEPLAPGAPDIEQAQDKINRMSSLGGISMQMEGLVRAKIAAATTGKPPVDNTKLIPKESTAGQPINTELQAALQAYADAASSNQADSAQRKEAAILAASKALGHTVTPAEIQTYFKSQAEAIAPVIAEVAAPITVASLGLAKLPQLAQDLGVSEDILANYTLEQLRQAIQNLESREYNEVQTLQAEMLSATGNRRAQIQQRLQRLGQSGAANIEASFDALQAQVDSADKINFAGKSFSIKGLLSSNGLSSIITNAINSPEALKRLQETEPELAKWITDNRAALAALSAGAGEVAQASKTTQNTVASAASNLTPALFTALFGARPTNISAADAAILQAKIAASPAYKWAMQSPENLRILEDMVAKGLPLPTFDAPAPDGTGTSTSIPPTGTTSTIPPVGTDTSGTATPGTGIPGTGIPGTGIPGTATPPPIPSGVAILNTTKAAELPANATAAAAAGYTPGGVMTPAQATLFTQWQTELKGVNDVVARDPEFLKAIAPGGTLTPTDMALLRGDDGEAVWQKALEMKAWGKGVNKAIASGTDEQKIEKLFNMAMGMGDNGMSLSAINTALKKLEAYANTGDTAAQDAWMRMKQIIGTDGKLDTGDMELLKTLMSPKEQTISYLIKNGGSIADTILGLKQQLQGATNYRPGTDNTLKSVLVDKGYADDKFLDDRELNAMFFGDENTNGLDNTTLLKLMESPWVKGMMSPESLAKWQKEALRVNPDIRLRRIPGIGAYLNDGMVQSAEMTDLYHNNYQAFETLMNDEAAGGKVEGMDGWKALKARREYVASFMPNNFMQNGKMSNDEMTSLYWNNRDKFNMLMDDPNAVGTEFVDNYQNWANLRAQDREKDAGLIQSTATITEQTATDNATQSGGSNQLAINPDLINAPVPTTPQTVIKDMSSEPVPFKPGEAIWGPEEPAPTPEPVHTTAVYDELGRLISGGGLSEIPEIKIDGSIGDFFANPDLSGVTAALDKQTEARNYVKSFVPAHVYPGDKINNDGMTWLYWNDRNAFNMIMRDPNNIKEFIVENPYQWTGLA